jgi:hypothetical protein
VHFKAKFADRGVVVPGDPKAEFGEARPPVAGTVNGTPFRGRLMVYGGVTYLGFRKEIREAAGIEEGATIEVEFERDDAPREVEVPAPPGRKSGLHVAKGGTPPVSCNGPAITHTRS